MGKTRKNNDAGWFYHAPEVRKATEPVAVPPASQIPGLSELPDDGVDDRRQMLIRDTDSDYIKLCKEGGRRDLLVINDPKPRSDKAKAYPRVDWYYQEDNMLEDEKTKSDDGGKHKFLLPDYMVHNAYKGGDNAEFDRQRAPFAYDSTTVFDREGSEATNKALKIDEQRPQGYGIRQQKQTKSPAKHSMQKIKIERARGRRGELESAGHKFHPVTAVQEDDNPAMGKILSHGYVQDWQDQRAQWQKKQQKLEAKMDSVGQPRERMQGRTEYQEKLSTGNTPPSIRKFPHRSEAGSGKKRQEKPEEKEPFIMSRFKNIPARTDNHRKLKPLPPIRSDKDTTPWAVDAPAN